MRLSIAEIPSPIWDLRPTLSLRIDRSSVTVAEYLKESGVDWSFGASDLSDIQLRKEDTAALSPTTVLAGTRRRLLFRKPYLSLIGEPREFATAAYFFARCENTLAVAPGNQLKRLFFASEWIDPELEAWRRRLNRICWIGRPSRERIEIARQLRGEGIPFDIYSKERWPVPEWNGYAEDEVETARFYRYRIVCENSWQFGYHSEKLFNSIRSGCVTFYKADPSLELTHAEETFLPLEPAVLKDREDLAPRILEGIGRFMFTNAWETYSFKAFYDRIISLAIDVVRKR